MVLNIPPNLCFLVITLTTFPSQIKLWSKQPSLTRLATPAQSWIDDYFDWMKHCCERNSRGEYCPPTKADTSDSGDEYGEYGEYGDYSEYGEYDPGEEGAASCEPCLLGKYKKRK